MTRPLHVGLNLVFLVPHRTGGMEVAARALIPELVSVDDDVVVTAFVGKEGVGEDLGAHRTVVVPVHADRRIERVVGEQVSLPPMAHRARCDVVHSLASTGPAWGRFARVVTVYDLHYATVADAHSMLRGWGMRALVPLSAARAHRVIVPSVATRSDVVSRLRVRPDDVAVVPLGPGRAPAATPTEGPVLRQRLGLGDRDVAVMLAAKRPHKNIETALDALRHIPAARRPVLVVAGYSTAHEAVLRTEADRLGVAGDVRWLDWISDEDADGLLGLASVSVLVSLGEGFGLPIVEAMARGVPVVCSDRGALAEVAGDAALVVDATDAVGIARAIETVLGDAAIAAALRRAGRQRAQRLSWRRNAEMTVAIYRQAVERRAGSHR